MAVSNKKWNSKLLSEIIDIFKIKDGYDISCHWQNCQQVHTLTRCSEKYKQNNVTKC